MRSRGIERIFEQNVIHGDTNTPTPPANRRRRSYPRSRRLAPGLPQFVRLGRARLLHQLCRARLVTSAANAIENAAGSLARDAPLTLTLARFYNIANDDTPYTRTLAIHSAALVCIYMRVQVVRAITARD